MKVKSTKKNRSVQESNVVEDINCFSTILLPVVLICIFCVYWFLICPLLWLEVRSKHHGTAVPYIYWGVALLIFILLMLLLYLIIWYCKRKRTYQFIETMEINEENGLLTTKRKTSNSPDCVHIPLKVISNSEHKDNETLNKILENRDSTDGEVPNKIESNKPGHKRSSNRKNSVEKHIKFENFDTEREEKLLKKKLAIQELKLKEVDNNPEPIEQQKSPLTPREEFFSDLYQNNGNQPRNSMFCYMDEKKPKDPNRRHTISEDTCKDEGPKVIQTVAMVEPVRQYGRQFSSPESAHEFFIANVNTKKDLYQTEVVMTIGDDSSSNRKSVTLGKVKVTSEKNEEENIK